MRQKFLENRPIGDHFLDIVRKYPDKECIVEVESNQSMTFSQFNEHANKYGNFFKVSQFCTFKTEIKKISQFIMCLFYFKTKFLLFKIRIFKYHIKTDYPFMWTLNYKCTFKFGTITFINPTCFHGTSLYDASHWNK